MSHSQFYCTGRVYLDLHGLIFETSICYWQDQPGSQPSPTGAEVRPRRVCWKVGIRRRASPLTGDGIWAKRASGWELMRVGFE